VTVQTSDNDVRDTHAQGAGNEDGLATKLIDIEDGGDRGEHEQDTTNTTGQKRSGVASQTQVLEDESGVVENSVDTRPYTSKSVRITWHDRQRRLTLLEDHGEDGDKDSLAQRLVCKQGGVVVESKLEVVREASRLELRELGPRSVDFEHVLSLDLEELELYDLAVLGRSSKVGKDIQSLVLTVVGYEPAGTGTG
jgi:hypothetical protein